MTRPDSGGKPPPTTWNACARATTCSNTTPTGRYAKKHPASWNGPAPWDAVISDYPDSDIPGSTLDAPF